jgi:hypothetical protein
MAGSKKAKKGAPIDKNAERVAEAAGLVASLSAAAPSPFSCKDVENLVNRVDSALCAAKVNVLPHAGDHVHTGCNCGGGGNARFMADVIVLIDTSGSMTSPTPTGPSRASLASAAVNAAVAAAKANCNVDLRIAYMGVEGTIAGTVFTTDYLAFLKTILNPDPPFATDNPTGGLGQEEGANAIEDLSKYYNWRPDACRAIFYISDERLDSINTPQAQNAAAVNAAVAAANANGVTVFAHYITQPPQPAWVLQQYQQLCTQTGGQLYASPTASQAEYVRMLSEAICKSCGKPRCRTVEVPRLEPCISISWGDSKCDCFETDDTEIVCVTVCNCYSNVSFSNFSIMAAFVTMPGGGAVPTLPDGTASVQMIPLGPVCFGDIPPCRDNVAGCVSRQYVVRTRGAKSGPYEIRLLGICYDVCFHYNETEVFTLTLCAD